MLVSDKSAEPQFFVATGVAPSLEELQLETFPAERMQEVEGVSVLLGCSHYRMGFFGNPNWSM